MSKETIAAVVAAYFHALRAMDAAAWTATFAEDAVSHDPVGAPPHQGKAAIGNFVSGVFPLFKSFGLTEDGVFIAGNTAAVKWKGQGVGKNGKSVTFEGIDVIEVNEQGKIQTVRAYWDPGPVLATVTG